MDRRRLHAVARELASDLIMSHMVSYSVHGETIVSCLMPTDSDDDDADRARITAGLTESDIQEVRDKMVEIAERIIARGRIAREDHWMSNQKRQPAEQRAPGPEGR